MIKKILSIKKFPFSGIYLPKFLLLNLRKLQEIDIVMSKLTYIMGSKKKSKKFYNKIKKEAESQCYYSNTEYILKRLYNQKQKLLNEKFDHTGEEK